MKAVVAALLWLTSIGACASRTTPSIDQLPARPALGAAIDRVGRPLTANAFVGLLAPEQQSDARKETYNRARPRDWAQFVPDIQHSLGLYDGFDGVCGNQWLAARAAGAAARDGAAAARDGAVATRYAALATLLADDRLWIDTRATRCTRFFAVELAALGDAANDDCGGRTPGDDAVDVIRSMLVDGTTTSITDGVDRDDHTHSTTAFPFLGAP